MTTSSAPFLIPGAPPTYRQARHMTRTARRVLLTTSLAVAGTIIASAALLRAFTVNLDDLDWSDGTEDEADF